MLELLGLQTLNGLSHASTLFLMASGLTLIFGVTRMVNFAHGSFFMLGALSAAHAITRWVPDWAEHPALYGLVMLGGALLSALVGALVEWGLLRRMRRAPELYQLVATFGLTLVLHDVMRAVLGPDEVFAPRFPGLKGAIALGESYFPTWQLLIMGVGPLVWLGLHLLLTRTRWGRQVKAATQDPTMLEALGIRTGPLMMGVVMLGCGLAGLAGALQLPREPAHLQMDMAMVVETFVVVVTGGLGSVGGAFAASVLIGLIHALGVSFWPEATLVLVFLTMAAVLIWRPEGLACVHRDTPSREQAPPIVLGAGGPAGAMALGLGLVWLLWSAVGGDYARGIAEDVLVMVLFGLSLQSMMALGGLVSFGHAAFFAMGAYAAALGHLHGGWSLWLALPAGALAAALLALPAGVLVIRSQGVYLAMLSLALAQIIWALASQWQALTGGDNGLIGLQLVDPSSRTQADVGLLVSVGGVMVLWTRWLQSSRGAALQAARDAPMRARASGLPVQGLRYQIYVFSAALAGLSGAWWAAFKGAVFPSVASVSTSVDALLVILLGGVHQWAGAWLGSALLVAGSAWLGAGMDYWRGWLGVAIMALMLLAPSGLLAGFQGLWSRALSRREAP